MSGVQEFDVVQTQAEAEAKPYSEMSPQEREKYERIDRWKKRVFDLESVPSQDKDKGEELEKIAVGIETEYFAVKDAHEKLFADRYRITDEHGVTSYFYFYPNKNLWRDRPREKKDIMVSLFRDAEFAYRKAKKNHKADDMEIKKNIYSSLGKMTGMTGNSDYYIGPSSAVESRDDVSVDKIRAVRCDSKKGCGVQGGSKKSISKYSRKSKSRYSRKSKSRYSRKSKSKYSRKY
jgi:hypothetical protein